MLHRMCHHDGISQPEQILPLHYVIGKHYLSTPYVPRLWYPLDDVGIIQGIKRD